MEEFTRRNFIKAAATIPAAGGCLYTLSNVGPLQCGVVGCGKRAESLIYLSNSKFIKIQGVYDPDHNRALRLQNAYQGRYRYASTYYQQFQEMLNDRSIEAVIIATPLLSHGDLAIQALKAGKHVFVERMMAATPEECREMVTLTEQHHLTIQVGHPQFFSPVFWDAFQLIQYNVLGNIYHIRIETKNIHSFSQNQFYLEEFLINKKFYWKHDSNLSYGIWSEQCSDWIAWVQGLFPFQKPIAVQAHANRVNAPSYYDIDSNCFAMIEYENNLTVSFSSQYRLESLPMDSIQIMGTKGTVKILYDWRVPLYQALYDQEPVHHFSIFPIHSSYPKHIGTIIDVIDDNELAEIVSIGSTPAYWEVKQKGSLSATVDYMTGWQLNGFAHAIKINKPVYCDAVMGMQIASTCFAAQLAAQTKERILVEV